MHPLPHDWKTLNTLRDEARLQADALRRAALDDVWRGANAALATAATQARRSAQRLAHRLQRHQVLRGLG